MVAPNGIPIGPGLHAKFLLGADDNGRDVMVRLMYGGRTSIYIGVMAAFITTFFAVAVGLAAGYWRGWTDSVLSRAMDLIWAFPVLLLGIALGHRALGRGPEDRAVIGSRPTRSGSRS